MSPLANESSENCNEKCTQKSGRRQRVDFCPYVRVLSIPNRSEFSEGEVQAAWYNCDELQNLKERFRTAIGRLSSHGGRSSCDGEGLETKDESMERRTRVHESRFVIFLEQEFQWEEDIEDPEYVADLYFDYTSYSQCLAQERAAALAKHVQETNCVAPQKTYDMTADVSCSKNLVSPVKKRCSLKSLVLSPFSSPRKGAIEFIEKALASVQLAH
jgi:hypothetical protein